MKVIEYGNDNTIYTLTDCVEHIALGVADDVFKEEKGIEEVMKECKILDSLSDALIAIKS